MRAASPPRSARATRRATARTCSSSSRRATRRTAVRWCARWPPWRRSSTPGSSGWASRCAGRGRGGRTWSRRAARRCRRCSPRRIPPAHRRATPRLPRSRRPCRAGSSSPARRSRVWSGSTRAARGDSSSSPRLAGSSSSPANAWGTRREASAWSRRRAEASPSATTGPSSASRTRPRSSTWRPASRAPSSSRARSSSASRPGTHTKAPPSSARSREASHSSARVIPSRRPPSPRRAVAPPLLARTRRTFPKMALRHRLSPRLSSTLALLGAALLAPAGERAWATSKAKVAAIGDAAPGGGVFVGPGFVAGPTAAGNGWIAFRGQVSGGTSSETIVAAHLTPPVSRAQVASIGQTAPSGNGYEACAVKLKQFVGHPVVNASGEVAFIALLTPPPDKSRSSGSARGPALAGLFALRGGQLVAVACSGEEVGGRTLDLTAVLDLASDPSSDVADRSPGMNDAGDVAFLAGYVDALGFPNGGAILLAPRAGGMTRLVRIDDPFASGRLQALGPPVLNNRGILVFHALSTTTEPSDHGMLDGVFAVDATGANLRVLVRNGIAPSPAGQPLTEFQDAVALDDDGDVAFLAGPLSDDTNPSDEGSPGVLVLRGGVVSLLAYPGQLLGPGKVTGVALGPAGGGTLAAPSIGPDGTVAFFASLEGNAEVIARTAGRGALPLVYTGGNGADASPVGGLYGGAESPPALDAAGGIVFLARIVNGQSSEAIVYRAADGRTSPIALGEAAPQQSPGFFAGQPFSAAHLNDAGDVVFRAYVARGPDSIGIFRARSARIDAEHGIPIEAVLRAGDASPGSPPFF